MTHTAQPPQDFDSTDAVRTGQPLRHVRTVTFPGPLALEQDGTLPAVTVAYETYGTLSPARDNAVLICHALSGDSHVARHDPTDDPGWWDIMVGPGRPIDTERWFVICPNLLGGCRGSTGPNSTNPATGKPFGPDFPVVTVGDMVAVQAKLLDHLGIDRLHAVVGGSLGGHQALTWATRYPQRVGGTVALATSPRLTSQALAFDVVGRNAILRDPCFHNGEYYGQGNGPDVGLAIARMLGHITYLSPEAMTAKFDADRFHPRDIATQFEKKFSVGSYLAYQGDRFVERFDANSYLTLSMAMDLFNLGHGPALAQALDRGACRWLVVSFTSDWLFPPFQSQEIVDALIALRKPVSYCNVQSNCGHDAFLLPDNLACYGEMVRAFLANVDAAGPAAVDPADDDATTCGASPTSIFHARRLDYDLIAELIPATANVLDLGCGTGGLLSRLVQQSSSRRVVGLELDERAILTCVRRGLDVVQADLNQGLAAFAEHQFDFVVLSQTLQAVRHVEAVMREMLRVGRRGIVSFPNFAFRKLRHILAQEGRAPRSTGWLGYQWYDTPNIRFLSIADFEDFCAQKGITIHHRIALDTEAGTQVEDDPNLNADVAMFVVSR